MLGTTQLNYFRKPMVLGSQKATRKSGPAASAEVQADIQEYLEAGGKITVLPPYIQHSNRRAKP